MLFPYITDPGFQLDKLTKGTGIPLCLYGGRNCSIRCCKFEILFENQFNYYDHVDMCSIYCFVLQKNMCFIYCFVLLKLHNLFCAPLSIRSS